MTLKRELEDSSSPIRRFFADHLAITRQLTTEYRDALEGATTILPDPEAGRPPWSMIGHAISALLQWQLSPPGTPTIAGLECRRLSRHTANEDVCRRFEEVVLAGPADLNPDEAARVAWLGGLLDMVCRSGVRDDPLLIPVQQASSWNGLLHALPTAWVADVAAMSVGSARIIEEHSTPAIVIDPVFVGSGWVGGADGDYIAEGGALVDIKATKTPSLATRDLRQILSYALLDWEDEYGIRSVGILAVRQSRLVTWPLDQALSAMAGRDVTASEMRRALMAALDT